MRLVASCVRMHPKPFAAARIGAVLFGAVLFAVARCG
jgi:hypothetical protein